MHSSKLPIRNLNTDTPKLGEEREPQRPGHARSHGSQKAVETGPAKLVQVDKSKETSGGSGATHNRIEGPGHSLGLKWSVYYTSGHREAL